MHIPLLRDVIVIFGLSIFVLLFCLRLRIPSLVGLLFTGVVSGPYGLQLVRSVHEVEVLSEIGIALLLFSIGMELSLKRFLRAMKQVLVGGSLQVGICLAFSFAMAKAYGATWQESLFVGFLISLSSTAIVLKLLQERYAVGTPHGELVLSTLVYQDLVVVPMMLLIPFLGGERLDLSNTFWLVAGDTVGILVIVLVLGTWACPRLLYQVAKTGSSRLFLLTVLFICFFVSWLTASIGLSLALGAFLSGLIISESEYNQHALGNIHPFQEIFTLFFFVSVGMLLDAHFVYENLGMVACALVTVTAIKMVAGIAPALILGYPLKRALLAGFALAQVGEFSFLLMREGIKAGIGDLYWYQLFLATAISSMALTPLWVWLAPHLSRQLAKLPLPHRLRFGKGKEVRQQKKPQENHIVILGVGAAGHQLRDRLREAELDYVLLENDPEVVRDEAEEGEPIVFGDGTHPAVLEHVHLQNATAFAVLIRDPHIAQRAIASARKLRPDMPIIARTRSNHEVESLRHLGATEVVPDDVQCATKVFALIKAAIASRSSEQE